MRGPWPALDRARVERWVSAVVAGGSGAVLLVAAWLEPSPSGHGTHLQLGLRPCSFLSATGWPCPMCGATTTFALMASLHPVAAVLNQPFASLLFALTLGAFGVSAAEAVYPRRRWSRILAAVEPVEHWLALAFLGVMAASWAWKAALMRGWIALG